MAINPSVDLLTDALAAAEPQRAKAAEEKLAGLSAQADDADNPDLTQFQAILASQKASLSPAALAGGMGAGTAHTDKGSNPYQQFEVTVLKSLFESMLPEKAASVFGSGFSGEVWRSMLAQSLADAAGRAGGTGIAHNLEAKARHGQPDTRSKRQS